MKNKIRLSALVLAAAMSFTIAQTARAESDDGVTSGGVFLGDELPLSIQKKNKTAQIAPVYLVPFRSLARDNIFVATLIKMINKGSATCDFQVDFYVASSNSCTLNGQLGPLVDPAGPADTAFVCSRSVNPFDRWGLCIQTCSPELNFNDGKALISMDKKCAADVAIYAQQMNSFGTTMVGVNDIPVEPIGKKK